MCSQLGESSFQRNNSLGPIRHWKGCLPSGSTRSSLVCLKEVWQLFHSLSLCIVQPLFKSTHYDLIDSLGLSIPLWIGQSGISVFYSQIATVSPEDFTIKLKSIVRDEGMGDSKSCDNIFPNKSFGIHVFDICQWFSFNPFGEIVYADQQIPLISCHLREIAHNIQPP